MIDGDYKIGADYSELDDVEEIKPCPFCGGKAEIDYTCRGNYPGVYCNNCSAYIFDYSYSEEKAIEKWNRRVFVDIYSIYN